MAKTQKTPEEIQVMEDEVRTYRAEESRKKAGELREAGKSLIEFVEGGTLEKVEEALPGLRQLALDQGDGMPYLSVYCDALHNGIIGLRRLRGTIPGEVPTAPAAPEG